MPWSSSRVAAVWRASWTLASRRPAALMRERHSAQSSRESIGAPNGVQNTRSTSSQAGPGGDAFRGLLAAVRAELVDERGRQRQD
jgi:hypothetical protein